MKGQRTEVYDRSNAPLCNAPSREKTKERQLGDDVKQAAHCAARQTAERNRASASAARREQRESSREKESSTKKTDGPGRRTRAGATAKENKRGKSRNYGSSTITPKRKMRDSCRRGGEQSTQMAAQIREKSDRRRRGRVRGQAITATREGGAGQQSHCFGSILLSRF